MVQKERILHVNVNENGIHQIEGFIEEICDDFNIFNSYFGNIMMTVIEACENAFISLNESPESKNINIRFWSEKNKLIFEIKGEKDVYIKKEDIFKLSNVDNLELEKEENYMIIINMLADEIDLNDKDNSIKVIFYISSINHNTSIQRQKVLSEYYDKVLKKIETHE